MKTKPKIKDKDREDLKKLLRCIRGCDHTELSDITLITGLSGQRVRGLVLRYGQYRFRGVDGLRMHYCPRQTFSQRQSAPGIQTCRNGLSQPIPAAVALS